MTTNAYTDLPASVIPADIAEALPIHDAPAIGESVVIYSRGRYRVARVVKTGPKNIRAEFTTPGAITEAERIAGMSRVASIQRGIATDERQAVRYRAQADLIESLGIRPTEDDADSFVPLASLPAEYAKLDAESGSNAARSTIVWNPATLRKWADSSDAHRAKAEAGMDDARAWDAKPFAEKVAEHVHMTTKTVKRGEVRTVPATVLADNDVRTVAEVGNTVTVTYHVPATEAVIADATAQVMTLAKTAAPYKTIRAVDNAGRELASWTPTTAGA